MGGSGSRRTGLAAGSTRVITKPLRSIAAAANRIAVGDVNQNMTHTSSDETGTLVMDKVELGP